MSNRREPESQPNSVAAVLFNSRPTVASLARENSALRLSYLDCVEATLSHAFSPLSGARKRVINAADD